MGGGVSWKAQAKCAEIGPADWLFFVRASNLAGPAKAVCRECPVIAECLAEALDISLRESPVAGVWGATSEADRAQILRRMSRRCPDCGVNVPGARPKRCEVHRAEALANKHRRYDERHSA
jgi:WhiB family redox-sensing transcriptional regulator